MNVTGRTSGLTKRLTLSETMEKLRSTRELDKVATSESQRVRNKFRKHDPNQPIYKFQHGNSAGGFMKEI